MLVTILTSYDNTTIRSTVINEKQITKPHAYIEGTRRSIETEHRAQTATSSCRNPAAWILSLSCIPLTVPDATSPGARPSSFVLVRPISNHTPSSPRISNVSVSPCAGLPVAVSRACEVMGDLPDGGAEEAISTSLDVNAGAPAAPAVVASAVVLECAAEICRAILFILLLGVLGVNGITRGKMLLSRRDVQRAPLRKPNQML